MSKKIFITYNHPKKPKFLHTTEGLKKLDKDGQIEVTVETALHMVDGVLWTTDENMKKLKQEIEKTAKKEKESFRDQQEDEDIEDEKTEDEEDEDQKNEDKETEDTDDEETEDDEDDTEDIGDDETNELIKRLPKMKYIELKETAEEAGIDVSKYPKSKKTLLIKKIIKVLKGKD